MSILKAGEVTRVVDPKSFKVVTLNNTVMPADDRAAKVEFKEKFQNYKQRWVSIQEFLKSATKCLI